MYKISCARWKHVFLILLPLPLWMAAEKTFQSEMKPLKWPKKRDKTTLITLDKLGEELLSRYHQSQQQGEIYYYLAHQHAQGGMVFPQKVIDYAYKAVSHPLTPDQKMHLYVYRGDAFMVLNRQKRLEERRREAVDCYLQGLKDLKSFQLPDIPPVVPNNPPLPPMAMRAYKTEQDAREASRIFKEEGQKYMKAREHAEFIRTMMKHRDVLQGQIVALYGRRPIATEELKNKATSILGEGKELDRLMTAVNDRIAKLPPDQTPNMTPVETAAPAMSSKYLYLSIAAGAGAVLAIGLLILFRWRRAKRVG